MSLTGLDFLNAINMAVSVLIALVFHELAHGFVSYKLGDPTPKMQGRLTLNPMAPSLLSFFHFVLNKHEM